MKVDREMEILLNEIPLLHHVGLLGGSEAGADDDADLSFLIHELAAMGLVDGDDELPAPGAATGYGFPTKGENLVAMHSFSMASHYAHMRSLFVPVTFDDAAAADGWDIRCSPPPYVPLPSPATPRARCKSVRRKNGSVMTTSPKKCGAAAAAKWHGESLAGLRGVMYHMARDQHGCRLLQQRLDDGKREVDYIFAGVWRHAAQLMVDPFGNYLMQKLLAVCDDGQRMTLVLTLTADPFALVRISLNVHGYNCQFTPRFFCLLLLLLLSMCIFLLLPLGGLWFWLNSVMAFQNTGGAEADRETQCKGRDWSCHGCSAPWLLGAHQGYQWQPCRAKVFAFVCFKR
jgi:hypothetical protein